ncbi:MAG: 4-hydroxy-tetrahydrodipicolinate reductase [Pseudomonadota bacterium]|nr:4-hydroxy-tetrahydrodipicolinate reductase [Pseudomonadota bacterium]
MDNDLKVGILGGAGRMGQMTIRQVAETEGCVVTGVTCRPGSAAIGRDAGELVGIAPLGVLVSDDTATTIAAVDVVIDFTVPDVAVEAAQIAARAGVALVEGTTGLSTNQEDQIARAADYVPVIRAANTSVGVTLLAALAKQAAQMLGEDYDIEVLEMHHRHKIDAPSGTALALGEALASGRGVDLEDVKQAVRDGQTGSRKPGDIGFATLRGGDVAGEHEIIFATEGERLILGHKASSRQVFSTGAVRAALWARAQSPGLYSMRNVLGFED